MRTLGTRTAAVALLVAQLAIVTSIAAKYLYERRTRPRVWVQASSFDPNTPLRGRYFNLRLALDACALPQDAAHFLPNYSPNPSRTRQGYWQWTVSLDVVNGHLVPRLEQNPKYPDKVHELTLWTEDQCSQAHLAQGLQYFVPDTAKSPFSLRKGETLWVEVTVPESGPPRPIQLALSGPDGFKPLHFD